MNTENKITKTTEPAIAVDTMLAPVNLDDSYMFCDNPNTDFDRCPIMKQIGGCEKCSWSTPIP